MGQPSKEPSQWEGGLIHNIYMLLNFSNITLGRNSLGIMRHLKG